MEAELSSDGYWLAALIWAVVAAALVLLLRWRVRREALEGARWAVPVAAALFWGVLAAVLVRVYWEAYYQHFYSAPLRLVVLLVTPFFYAALGALLWWLARRLSGNAPVTFCLLGGLEALVEHLVAIYWLGILERVPMLQGADPLAVLAFSVPEYVVYWGLVLGLAALLARARRMLVASRPTAG